MQHVPFDNRNREVIYITDAPNPHDARRRGNGFGVAGFVLSLLGFFTCGVLSPLGLLFSLLGMFRAPRGLATAGLAMGMVGTGAIGMFVAAVHQESNHHHSVAVRNFEMERTHSQLIEAKQEIEQYRLDHEGRMPEGVEGNKIVVTIEDGWNTSLGYEPDNAGYTIRSAGPDGEFNSNDDITSRVAIADATIAGIESLEQSLGRSEAVDETTIDQSADVTESDEAADATATESETSASEVESESSSDDSTTVESN